MFKIFGKLKDSCENNKQGTGLGLMICKKLTEALGGKIWVNSQGQGLGSTFTFEIKIDISTSEEMNDDFNHMSNTGRCLMGLLEEVKKTDFFAGKKFLDKF